MEESPTEGSKSKLFIVSVIVIILVIASIGIYLIGGGASVEGITAMEGSEIADEVALNWSANATLVSVRIAGSMGDVGHFSAWYYVYAETSNVSDDTECVEIKITADGEHLISYEHILGPSRPILSWNIDSDEAYEVAKDHPEIKNYLSTYSGVVVESFSLGQGGTYGPNPVWYIHWEDYSIASTFENYHKAWVRIDAVTGEVLDIEFQNG